MFKENTGIVCGKQTKNENKNFKKYSFYPQKLKRSIKIAKNTKTIRAIGIIINIL